MMQHTHPAKFKPYTAEVEDLDTDHTLKPEQLTMDVDESMCNSQSFDCGDESQGESCEVVDSHYIMYATDNRDSKGEGFWTPMKKIPIIYISD
jgi:hypothetical protein